MRLLRDQICNQREKIIQQRSIQEAIIRQHKRLHSPHRILNEERIPPG